MAGYCTSVRPYFHEPQVSENTAQECCIQSYWLNHKIIDKKINKKNINVKNVGMACHKVCKQGRDDA